MARTAFFGKTSNSPRTRFYANRDPLLTLDRIKAELNQLNHNLAKNVGDAQIHLSKQSDNLNRQLEDINRIKLPNLGKSIKLIKNDTKILLQGLVMPLLSIEQAEKFYLCFRAINRIEDYILDKDFKINESNDHLNNLISDKLTENTKEYLKENKKLQSEFSKLYGPFKTGDIPERNGRLESCQKLRQEIIRYFAAQQPMDQDGSPLIDQISPVTND